MSSIDFNQLFFTYSRRLHCLAYSYAKDSFLAEDIVQEAFLKAYKKIDSIEDTNKIGSWLSAITARTAIDFLRMENRKNGRLIGSSEIMLDITAAETNTEEEAGIRLFKEEISQSIEQLSKESQEVLSLKINLGLNEKEIASRLHLKPSTVKTRLYRARKQLKQVSLCKESA